MKTLLVNFENLLSRFPMSRNKVRISIYFILVILMLFATVACSPLRRAKNLLDKNPDIQYPAYAYLLHNHPEFATSQDSSGTRQVDYDSIATVKTNRDQEQYPETIYKTIFLPAMAECPEKTKGQLEKLFDKTYGKSYIIRDPITIGRVTLTPIQNTNGSIDLKVDIRDKGTKTITIRKTTHTICPSYDCPLLWPWIVSTVVLFLIVIALSYTILRMIRKQKE